MKKSLKEHLTRADGKINNQNATKERLIKHGYFDALMAATAFMSPERETDERIQAFFMGLTEDPTCKMCGGLTAFRRLDKDGPNRFNVYCSRECQHSDPAIKQKMNETKANNNVHEKANLVRQKTLLAKYGYAFNSQRPEVKEIITNTPRAGGVTTSVKSKLMNIEYMHNEYIVKQRTLVDIAAELEISYSTVGEYCRKHEFEIRQYSNRSMGERELQDWIRDSLKINFTENDRTILKNRFELDIYVPEKKIAIEYCGEYYHSEVYKERSDHYNKYMECQSNGIDLIMLFESEWKKKKDLVKKFLSSRLGIYQQRVYARNCEVREVFDINQVRAFLKVNHIQGEPNSIKRAFGLFYENEMLGVTTFSHHHRQNYESIVLNRLAFKDNIQVVGGASKLVKNSLGVLNTTVITWSDNRWSNGSLYEKSGFMLDHTFGPDYFYTDRYIIKSKQTMTKKLMKCPPEMTEYEWNKLQGWFRIWDCGKKRWVFNGQNL